MKSVSELLIIVCLKPILSSEMVDFNIENGLVYQS